MTNDPPYRQGAFFGRRKGHPLRARQADVFSTLLPRLALDLTVAPPASLATLFPLPVDDVRVEIGFGGGEHLLAQAQLHPRTGVLGCEPFVNGMANAIELLDWLPDASIARVDLLYPDPWPKRRHWKRRFVNDESVAKFARIIRPGGEFRFASDWANYADWTLLRLARSPDFTWEAERADDWRKPWPEFVRTRYEAKAVRERRTPCYLI